MPNPYKILDFITIRNRKEIVVDADTNEKALDFSERIIEDNYSLKYSSAPILITEELAGKPAAISKIKYDDGSYADLLCYYNGISNPLMIPEGFVFFTPELSSMLSNVADKTNDRRNNKTKENLNKKLSQKDKNRIQSLIARAKASGAAVNSGAVDNISTPNMANDIPSTVASNGSIILGNNISNTRCSQELSVTQTRSEAIKKAIKNELTSRR